MFKENSKELQEIVNYIEHRWQVVLLKENLTPFLCYSLWQDTHNTVTTHTTENVEEIKYVFRQLGSISVISK